VKREHNIVVVEPSVLLYSGLTSVAGNSGQGLVLTRSESLDDVLRLVTLRAAEAVIINPVLILGNSKTLQSLRNATPGIRFIALVYAFFDESILSQFDGIITVNDPVEKIISAITGENSAARKQEVSQPDAGLSDREIEVLKLLAAGMSTKEIAEELHISTNTVISHRKNLSVKTGIRSVSGLTIYAVVKKHITPGSITL
jgi:DNA-binding CsgD family transcriptional regulator